MSDSSNMTKPDNLNKQKTLFTLMRDALKLAKDMKQQNIFLIGQTRSGKSTTFNWIVDHKQLLATGQEMDPFYQILNQNVSYSNLAQVKKGYKSVTLIPNIIPLSHQLGLIDMPGRMDQRTEIHVMMVSFIYDVFLKFSKKARFVLVITNQGFKANDSAKMVNLMNMFIKLFRCSQMTEEQLQNLFSSVSLLVTSVPVQKGKEQLMKTYYCKLLVQKLFFLKQLKEYEKFKEIYPYIEMMLNSIIENKRVEIFSKARFNQSAQPCSFLIELDRRQWKACQLQSISEFLKFPYSEQFLQLSNQQQTNLKRQLDQKILHYKTVQQLLSKFIEEYLKSPITNTCEYEQYEDIYDRLKEFYLENLIQNEEEKESQRDYIQKIGEGQIFISHSPILVLQNIINLNKITFQIRFEDDRNQDQKKINYFQYLKGFFIKSFNFIIQSFALTEQSHYIMLRIKEILSERIDHFMYISEIEQNAEHSFQLYLKEYIQIMNIFDYREFQIVQLFCKNANSQHINQNKLQIQQIKQIIKFLNSQGCKLEEIQLLFEISLKFYKMGAQKYKEQGSNQHCLEYMLQSLKNLANIKIIHQIQYNFQHNQELFKSIRNLNQQLERLLHELSIKILQLNNNKFANLEDLFKDLKIPQYMQKIYQWLKPKILKSPESQQLIFFEAYLKYSENQRKYQKAIEICRELIRLHKRSRKEQYRKKKDQLQMMGLSWRVDQQIRNQQMEANTFLLFTDLVFQRILSTQRKAKTAKEIQALFTEKYKNKKKDEQSKHQFTVQLPEKLTNYDIIVYSRYLAKKIKKRNSIVLLGAKTGKSVASYWLRDKELVKQDDRVESKDRIHIKSSTIKHNFSSHTEIPNIYSLNENQLLVDAPHLYEIYEKSPEKMLIIGYFLKEIFANSKYSKFILVLKEQDVLNKQCIPVVQMLQFYLKIFKDLPTNINLFQSLSLLITFCEEKNRGRVRQQIKKLRQFFSQEQNIEKIQYKYRLSRSPNPCSRNEIYLLLNHIFTKGLINYFDIKNKGMIINEINQNQHWISDQIHPKINNNYSSFNPTLQFKDQTHDLLIKEIRNKFSEAKSIINQLANMFQRVWSVQNLKQQLRRDEEQIWGHLVKRIGKQFVQFQLQLKEKNPNIKKFRQSELQIPYNSSKPQFSLMKFFNIIKITNIYNEGSELNSIADLKKITKAVCNVYMQALGSYFANTDILQIAWIKVWQILTELQILQCQTKFLKGGLNQRYTSIAYTYGLQFSSKQEIRQELFMTKSIQQLEWLQRFLNEFNLEKFQIQVKQQEKGFDFLYQALRTIKAILDFDTNVNYRIQRYQLIVNQIKKLKGMQEFFVKQNPNQYQAAVVLLDQCQIQIYAHRFKIQLGIKDLLTQQNILILILETNIDKFCQKIGAFKPQLALQISDQMRKKRLKQKIFEILRKKQLLTRTLFMNYYDLLIQSGNKNSAYNLFETYKLKQSLLEPQKQRLLGRIHEINIQQKKSQICQQLTLAQLQHIIQKIRQKLF